MAGVAVPKPHGPAPNGTGLAAVPAAESLNQAVVSRGCLLHPLSLRRLLRNTLTGAFQLHHQ
jgi:BarA-like signal transduction histidine kinase